MQAVIEQIKKVTMIINKTDIKLLLQLVWRVFFFLILGQKHIIISNRDYIKQQHTTFPRVCAVFIFRKAHKYCQAFNVQNR